jgi:disulfide bond formation protein DsbB
MMIPRGLLNEYASTLNVIARLLDVLFILLAALLAYYWRFHHINLTTNYQIALIIAALDSFIIFSWSGI